MFGVGEHHRPDFAVSAPAVVLAAAAERTQRIRLTSAVTVLSSDDPVRVFQDFATLDLLSGGRAEIMAGRGSFIESFPLFGYDLDDYDELFAEKLELLLELRESETRDLVGPAPRAARRPGRLSAPAAGPAADLGRGRRHAAVGRARRHARPADGAGDHRRRSRSASRRWSTSTARRRGAAGHDPAPLPVGINSHAYVGRDLAAGGATSSSPATPTMMNRIGRERGWPPMTREQFDAMRAPRGALWSAARRRWSRRSCSQHEIFGHQRFLAQMSVGTHAAREGHARDRAARHRGGARGARGDVAGLRLHSGRLCRSPGRWYCVHAINRKLNGAK